MYTEARKKEEKEDEEILCPFDKHPRHLVTPLLKKKRISMLVYLFRSRQINTRTESY